MRFSRTGGFAVALLATLALTGCGSDDTPAATATPSPTTSAAAPTTPVATTATSPTAPTAPTPIASPSTPASTADVTVDVTVDVTIAGGKVSAGQQSVVKAKAGQSVRINAVSDVADSLHVHGYDRTLELKPGKPARLEFTTGTKGIFEVETHETGKLVFKLQVS